MKPMTSDQKLALRMMSERNLGAVVTRFGWTWPCQIRHSEEIASAVVEVLNGSR